MPHRGASWSSIKGDAPPRCPSPIARARPKEAENRVGGEWRPLIHDGQLHVAKSKAQIEKWRPKNHGPACIAGTQFFFWGPQSLIFALRNLLSPCALICLNRDSATPRGRPTSAPH